MAVITTGEREWTIFCRIGNPSALAALPDFEDHQQYEAQIGTGGRCRVRKTTKAGRDRYTHTLKVRVDDPDGLTHHQESTVDVDEDYFNGFAAIATTQWRKRRYRYQCHDVKLTLATQPQPVILELPSLCYEIDVFAKPGGSIAEWCKIDVEMDQVLNYLATNYSQLSYEVKLKISHLPIEPQQAFLKEKATPEQLAWLEHLFQHEFAYPIEQPP